MLWMVSSTFTMNAVPQAFKPMYDLDRNQNFTGAPIIPSYLEDVSPSEQYRYYTSESMIALGRKMNISPIKAEYIVRGYLGTLGTWALGFSDAMIGDVNGWGQEPEKNWRDGILLSPFVNHGPLRRTDAEDDLYELLTETREVTNTIKSIIKRTPNRFEEYYSDPKKQVLQGLNDDLLNWSRSVREINNAMTQIRQDSSLSAKIKSQQIFELRREKNEITKLVRDNINPKMVDDVVSAIQTN